VIYEAYLVDATVWIMKCGKFWQPGYVAGIETKITCAGLRQRNISQISLLEDELLDGG
jgi:hypothetical protein